MSVSFLLGLKFLAARSKLIVVDSVLNAPYALIVA